MLNLLLCKKVCQTLSFASVCLTTLKSSLAKKVCFVHAVIKMKIKLSDAMHCDMPKSMPNCVVRQKYA